MPPTVPPTDDADYADAVAAAYWGEIYGIAMYAEIAAGQTDPVHRKHWETLTALEVATEARLCPLFERLGGDVTEHVEEHEARGRADGARFGAYDWSALMQRFSGVLARVITEYAAIERICPPSDAAVCRHVTEHEEVAKSFVDDELAGRTATSIEPVRRLIAELARSSGPDESIPRGSSSSSTSTDGRGERI